MKTRAKPGSTKARKGKGVAPKKAVTHVSQPQTSEWVKKKSDFVEWADAEQARLRSEPDDFANSYATFKKERHKRAQALLSLEQEARREKGERKDRFGFGDFGRPSGAPDVLPRPDHDRHVVAVELGERRLFGYSDFRLTPYMSQVLGPPLMEPCPDLEHWSAWFNNDQVGLSQQYRLWFPGGRYTGHFEVWPRVTLQGLVDIGAGGRVTVGAECGVAVVECTHEDRDHDNGWHYDPNYDTMLRHWRSVCEQPHPPYFVDTQTGLHTFTYDSSHVVAVGMDLADTCGAPGRFIQIGQNVSITAENAWVQFGPGASSGQNGWIQTPFPTVRLQRFQARSDIHQVAADGLL